MLSNINNCYYCSIIGMMTMPLFYSNTVETPKTLIVIIHTKWCTKWHPDNGRIWNGCYIFVCILGDFFNMSSNILFLCTLVTMEQYGLQDIVFLYTMSLLKITTQWQRHSVCVDGRFHVLVTYPRHQGHRFVLLWIFPKGTFKRTCLHSKPQTLADLKQAITE